VKIVKGRAKAFNGESHENGSKPGKGKCNSTVGTVMSGMATLTTTTADDERSEPGPESQDVQDAVDEGYKIWEKWANEQFKKWNINKHIYEVLKEGKEPLVIMRKLKTTEVSQVL